MDNIKQDLMNGNLVPFLGMGVFKGFTCKDGSSLPHDSDSMVLSLNNGRAMSPRLMYEYTRAAMSLEQRKGREYITQMINHIYNSKEYDLPFVYQFFKEFKPKYFIDTNMDDSSCKIYEDVAHFMITGVSRIMGGYDRFVVYTYTPKTKSYEVIDKSELNDELPILFKPMGCIIPDKNFIVSDADFVDWLTEAMGGYAVPPFLKEFRKNKSYLFLGIDFSTDTYRMVSNEITLELSGGFVVTKKEELSRKEDNFLKAHNLDIIPKDINDFLRSI